METVFTPMTSFQGGMAVGLGAVLLMLGLGRILGATGIMTGLMFFDDKENFMWRAALVLGMVLAPIVILLATGSMPQIDVPMSPAMIVIGGIIGGYGSSLGSGCTSGHGICGLSRLSIRSMVAVPTFMLTGGITVYVIRHVLGG